MTTRNKLTGEAREEIQFVRRHVRSAVADLVTLEEESRESEVRTCDLRRARRRLAVALHALDGLLFVPPPATTEAP